ncbi:MAG: thioredoxin family protein [Gammaproteobacteria bacterium]
MSVIINSNEYPHAPYPEPYEEIKVTLKELREFIKKSVDQNKQSLVIFGANWCPDAKFLDAVMQLPTVNSFLKKYVNILNIDIRKYEINTELFNFFDSDIKDGIPRVFIMDKRGLNINLDSNDAMRMARELSAQEIFNYFQEFIS